MSDNDKIYVEAKGTETFGGNLGCAFMILATLGGIALIIWSCGGLE